jgi:hypothetical protein
MSRQASAAPGADVFGFGLILSFIIILAVFAFGGLSLFSASAKIDNHQVTQRVSPQIEAATGGHNTIRDLHCAEDGKALNRKGDFTYCAFYNEQLSAKYSTKVVITGLRNGQVTTSISSIHRMLYPDAYGISANAIYKGSPSCPPAQMRREGLRCFGSAPGAPEAEMTGNLALRDARYFGEGAYLPGNELEEADEFFHNGGESF